MSAERAVEGRVSFIRTQQQSSHSLGKLLWKHLCPSALDFPLPGQGDRDWGNRVALWVLSLTVLLAEPLLSSQ